MEGLRSLPWFLGEISGDTAATILKASGDENNFVAYNHPSYNKVILALRPVSTDDKVEHLDVICTDGKYKVYGQMQEYDDIMQAVNSFVAHHNPPLKPAFETQTSLTNSITDTPPSYNQAQSALQPEVAPLPQISDIIAQPEVPTVHTNLPPYQPPIHGSHYWRYYGSLHCCHPRNVCHACCYSSGGHAWYNPDDKGLFLKLCLYIMWTPCLPCLGILACYVIIMLANSDDD